MIRVKKKKRKDYGSKGKIKPVEKEGGVFRLRGMKRRGNYSSKRGIRRLW